MVATVVDTIKEVRALLDEYEQFLSGKAHGTTDAYLRTARQMKGSGHQRPLGSDPEPHLLGLAVRLHLPGTRGRLVTRRSGVLSGASHQARGACSSNHGTLDPGQSGARPTET